MLIRRGMLMAAGLGTRLMPYTSRVPKPLLPLMNVPMAQFAVDGWVASGVTSITANVHHLADQARRGLQALQLGPHTRLLLSDESQRILGSAGGIRRALPGFEGEPFFYANADVLCPFDWLALAQRHHELRARLGVVMTLTVLARAPRGGRYREIHVDASGQRVSGLGDAVEQSAFFAGAAALEPEAFAHLPDGAPSDFVSDVLLPEIHRGRVGVHFGQGPWMDIGSPALWHGAHLSLVKDLEAGTVPAPWRRRIEGVSHPQGKGVWIGSDFRVDANRRLVVYGAPAAEGRSDGICFNGIWTACPAETSS